MGNQVKRILGSVSHCVLRTQCGAEVREIMDRKKMIMYLAVLIETVESSTFGAPEGHLYAAFMTHMTLDDFLSLVGTAVSGGLVTRKTHVLQITQKGRDAVQALAKLKQTDAS